MTYLINLNTSTAPRYVNVFAVCSVEPLRAGEANTRIHTTDGKFVLVEPLCEDVVQLINRARLLHNNPGMISKETQALIDPPAAPLEVDKSPPGTLFYAWYDGRNTIVSPNIGDVSDELRNGYSSLYAKDINEAITFLAANGSEYVIAFEPARPPAPHLQVIGRAARQAQPAPGDYESLPDDPLGR